MIFTIRPMRETDLANTLKWRNDPEVRKTSITDNIISAGEHNAMFLYNNSIKLIFEVEEIPSGYIQISIDPDTKKGEWAFHIASEYKGKGLSTIMLSLALYYLKEKYGYDGIEAKVKVDNKISIHLHYKLGFKCQYERDKLYHFTKNL